MILIYVGQHFPSSSCCSLYGKICAIFTYVLFCRSMWIKIHSISVFVKWWFLFFFHFFVNQIYLTCTLVHVCLCEETVIVSITSVLLSFLSWLRVIWANMLRSSGGPVKSMWKTATEIWKFSTEDTEVTICFLVFAL